MLTYKHSGDIGDVLYSLPTIRALGGGLLYLNANYSTKMTSITAEAIAALIRTQEYIHDVQIWQTQPINYDLDTFRLIGNLSNRNLADAHLVRFDCSINERNTPWLKAPNPVPCDILISRSCRYRNKCFNWQKMLQNYQDRNIQFVGLPNEHRIFCEEISNIPYYQTKDFSELANLIAGSKIFFGNQSAPLACAIGLGVNIEVEVDKRNPNCRYYRPNIKHHSIYPPVHGYKLV